MLLFSLRSRTLRLERAPTSDGIVPLKSFPPSSILVTQPPELVPTPRHLPSGLSLSQPVLLRQFGPSSELLERD